MKLDPKSAFHGPAVHAPQSLTLHGFFALHRDRLWQAARLLGGYESTRLVDRCADLLERHEGVTARTRLMAGQILSLLSLERVHDQELPYMGFFAEIDPADPVVIDICLLCNGLEGALASAEGA